MASRIKKIWIVLIILVALCFPCSISMAELVIADYRWTDKVNNLQPGQKLGTVTSPKPVHLWMRIEGTQEDLTALEQQGKLPIRCQWIRFAGPSNPQEEEGVLKDEIKLGVGQINVLTKLKYELMNEYNRCAGSFRCFDWRTWSSKENVSSNESWVVKVVYSDKRRTSVMYYKDGIRVPFEVGLRIK